MGQSKSTQYIPEENDNPCEDGLACDCTYINKWHSPTEQKIATGIPNFGLLLQEGLIKLDAASLRYGLSETGRNLWKHTADYAEWRQITADKLIPLTNYKNYQWMMHSAAQNRLFKHMRWTITTLFRYTNGCIILGNSEYQLGRYFHFSSSSNPPIHLKEGDVIDVHMLTVMDKHKLSGDLLNINDLAQIIK